MPTVVLGCPLSDQNVDDRPPQPGYTHPGPQPFNPRSTGAERTRTASHLQCDIKKTTDIAIAALTRHKPQTGMQTLSEDEQEYGGIVKVGVIL